MEREHESAWICRAQVPGRAGADGPLAGLRLAVKDNIDVAGLPTTAACPSFAYQPERSAGVVERLQHAGMQVVGKTNLDQFACGLNGTRSPYGPVRNAFDPNYVSGGSSSGSAVAVALGEADAALGTDTAGSGRVPAALNNIVGLKPTRGVLSLEGVVPACYGLDCVSVFATTVAGAVDVLLAGAEPGAGGRGQALLDAGFAPQQFRFGVPRAEDLEFYGDAQSADGFALACDALRALGGTSVEIDLRPFVTAARMLYEDAFVAERYSAIRSFFDAGPADMDPVVRGIVEGARRYAAVDVYDALRRLDGLRAQCDRLLGQVDALVLPSIPTVYRIDEMLADPVRLNNRLGHYTNFVNLLGYCAIAVPAAFRPDGLPAGITLVAPGGRDLAIADLAQRFHHATGLPAGATGRPLPAMRPIARPAGSLVRVAVVGAHLSGMPLNTQLLERAARLSCVDRTTDAYRLFALPGTRPPKPGLLRVAPGEGAPIVVEVWELPAVHYGSFVAAIPAPLGIGMVELESSGWVQGFACEPTALATATDITGFGGWRAYIASLASTGGASAAGR